MKTTMAMLTMGVMLVAGRASAQTIEPPTRDVPSKLTTVRWADAEFGPGRHAYLVLYDEVASWPALVTLIPEDVNEGPYQWIVDVPKGRRVSIDLGDLERVRGRSMNFALVVTIAEDRSTATLTLRSEADWAHPVRVQPDATREQLLGAGDPQ